MPQKLLINPPWPPFFQGGISATPPLPKGVAKAQPSGGFAQRGNATGERVILLRLSERLMKKVGDAMREVLDLSDG
jgi:hypothetical protein